MNRKISADNIFTGTDFIGPDQVLVVDAGGTIEGIIPSTEAAANIEKFEGIICPGFINAHCHIELSHLKNKIPQHTGLVNFVQSVMTQRAAVTEEKNDAMRRAEIELYESGTVAVGDICNTPDSIALKKNSQIYWHNFIEVSGFVNAGAQKRFDAANETAEEFRRALLSERSPSGIYGKKKTTLSPHAPYSVSEKLFSLINSATPNQLISIHNQESPAENELYQNKSGKFLSLYENFGIDISSFNAPGKSSFQSWLPYFTKGQRIIAVHNTFTKPEDLQILSTAQLSPAIFFCLCPNANLYIENTLPPVQMLMSADCTIVLGTDSYASNTQLNIFEEIKTIRQHFPEIPFALILKWATYNGAKALGIESKYGIFEKGKQPGVLLLKGEKVKRLI